MYRARRSWLALISTAAALAVAWWALPHVRELLNGSGQVEFVRPMAPSLPTAPPRSSGPMLPDSPEAWRYYLDEGLARSVFAIRKEEHVYDGWTYYRRLGGLNREYRWPEHPDGRWFLRTNSLGLREDGELATRPAQVRVLVAGDSHTYGACNNDESWPALLEDALATRLAQSVEVLNAAVDGFSLYHYFGTLQRFRSFEPQLFIVGVFGGNDFSEISHLYHLFSGTSQQQWPEAALAARDEAIEVGRAPMGQCFNSIQMFRTLPDEVDALTSAAIAITGEIADTCANLGIELLVLFIPAPCDMAWDPEQPALERVREKLRPSSEDESINRAMERAFLAGLRTRGLRVVDMRARFAAEPEPPYWRKDLHVNLQGQRVIRDELLPVVTELLD